METKTGRPSKYKPELDEQAEKLCRLGATDKEIAAFFGVRESTLNNWKLKHPSFVESLKRGKDEVDGLVEQSLFRRAMGYSHQSEKVFQYQGAIVRAKTVEHYPPDTTACIFWLKNRQPDSWRDKREEPPGGDDVQSLLRKLIAGLPA
ncbi:TPA: terminase [Stenotrophomonas maltophilia]